MHGGDDLISYNMSKKTDGDLNGEIQLHKMKPQEHFIEAQVQEGDTLQAIALRFYCSVSTYIYIIINIVSLSNNYVKDSLPKLAFVILLPKQVLSI